MNIAPHKPMVACRIVVILKRICIGTESIITDIRKEFFRQLLIINEQSAISQFVNLLLQSQRAFSIVHKNRRPPRVRCSMGSVGGRIGCKYSNNFLLQQFFFVFFFGGVDSDHF